MEAGTGIRENWIGRVEIVGDVNRSASSKDENVQTIEKESEFGENFKDSISANGNSQEDSFKRRNPIDLNLDVSSEFDDNSDVAYLGCSAVEIKKPEHKFDLNLEVCEEIKETEGDKGLSDIRGPSFDNNGQSQKGQNGGLIIVKSTEDACETGNVKDISNDITEVIPCSTEYVDRGIPPQASVIGASNANCGKDCSSTEVQLQGGPSETGITVINECQNDSGSPNKEGSSKRKRRKLSYNFEVTTEIILRRSSRRGSAKIHVISTKASSVMNDPLLSLGVSAQEEQKVMVSSCVEYEKPVFLPLKLQLPPSSKNLALDDIPILELFSIYAFLRSFSTMLFLSPFELEDFAAALKYRSPSTLFDNVHVSILQILRHHLGYLSNEGSQTASNCLRILNWDLVDLITWPIFMAEYLLIHGSGFKPGFNLNDLKLFKSDYYKQPVTMKVEILRLLCDDMIEAEAIRSELNRRSLEAETDIDFDQNVYTKMSKKRRVVFEASCGSCLDEGNADDITECVGISNDHLPEGDWYCPECAIGRRRPSMKLQKSLRGADLLGIDPHGRLYFSSCGYLLVSNSSDTGSLFRYYHSEDLNVVVEVLRSADTSYRTVIVNDETYCERKLERNTLAASSNHLSHEVSKVENCLDLVTAMESPCIPSDGSAETTRKKPDIENLPSAGHCDSNRSDEFSNQSGISEKHLHLADCSLTSNSLDLRQKNVQSLAEDFCKSSKSTVKVDTTQMPCDIDYINHYSFSQMASLVSEELMCKLPQQINENFGMSEEDIISAQAKAILNKSTNFCWKFFQNLDEDAVKEKCGWCFSCKVPTSDRDCLFNIVMWSLWKTHKNDFLGVQSKRNRKSHLTDKSLHKASDVASVKKLLLTLVSNLRCIALSADWVRHVDSVFTMGSASHIVTSSLCTSSRHGIVRKRSRPSDPDFNAASNPTSGLSLFWQRGAGCTKISGILYPDNSEYTKRSRYIAWRAAVETSTSVEQIALQVRELDSNIKWNDIENTNPISVLDKQSRKSIRLFKKEIV
ncbi:DDT domain-containing protein PTM [Quillaja saponaria]|uniref:DDT domain-containing protein PTM n=1 Tax=Quillaja saponaria TaxID=32244 RepID=A0AAD7LLV0_QUISA|nr:DDT domain-containing protein PTM [Quillaja saponaria]